METDDLLRLGGDVLYCVFVTIFHSMWQREPLVCSVYKSEGAQHFLNIIIQRMWHVELPQARRQRRMMTAMNGLQQR